MKMIPPIVALPITFVSFLALNSAPSLSAHSSRPAAPQNLVRVAQFIYQRKIRISHNAMKGNTRYDKLSQILPAAG